MIRGSEASDAAPRVLRIDGLAIRTTVEVPGVTPSDRMPDWHLDVVEAPLPLDDGRTVWTGDIRDDDGAWARFGHVGARRRIHLVGVGDLVVSPPQRSATLHLAGPDVDPTAALRRLLPYLAAADHRLVLHASCAVFPSGAAVFCAASGTGKSTLALALDAAGHPLLADDHVVVTPRETDLVAHASFPFVETDGRARAALRPEAGGPAAKAPLPLLTPRPATPVPVACLAFLERGADLAVEPLASAEGARRLFRDFLFVADPPSAPELAARLDGAAALVHRVRVVRLTLPDGLRRLGACVRDLPARLAAGGGA